MTPPSDVLREEDMWDPGGTAEGGERFLPHNEGFKFPGAREFYNGSLYHPPFLSDIDKCCVQGNCDL